MGLIPTKTPGDFSSVRVRYFLLNNARCCFSCPVGYKLADTLNIEISGPFTYSGTMDFINTPGGFFDGFAVPRYVLNTTVSNPIYPGGPDMAVDHVFACAEVLRGIAEQQCYDVDDVKQPVVGLITDSDLDYGSYIAEDFQAMSCDPTTGTAILGPIGYYGGVVGIRPPDLDPDLEPAGNPPCIPGLPSNPDDYGHCAATRDYRGLTDDEGRPWRCGCSRKIDVTFQSRWYARSGGDVTILNGSVRVHGDLCVVDPDSPTALNTRYWCVLKRGSPYYELVKGGKTTDLRDRAPADWLSGPYLGTDDSPPDVDCSIEPYWCVRYQDYDGGTPVGQPYPGCFQTGISGIICENWDAKVYCDGGTAGPHIGPTTVTTGLELDPLRPESAATVRSRTYVDGPWPSSRYCCLACPECSRMSKARKYPVYGFPPGFRWVGSDFGKRPGVGIVFENESYLNCRLGLDWNVPDVDRYGGGGRGYSLSRKTAIRNIVGGPEETLKGDDEPPESDGTLFPAELGEANQSPGPWGVRTGDPPGYSDPPDDSASWSLPSRWWVLPHVVTVEEPEGSGEYVTRLEIAELARVAYPSGGVWAAGPFDTEEEALGSATPDGPWWCLTWQNKDSGGAAVGSPYFGCALENTFPAPEPPEVVRIGYTVPDQPLDDGRDNSGATSRTLTVSDGPWLGAEGVGDSREDRCKANCPPCSQSAGAIGDVFPSSSSSAPSSMGLRMARPVPAMWYVVLVDGSLNTIKSSVRPTDDTYVAGPFATERKAGEYVG